MKRFLAQHDFMYETEPTRWLDGIPLGNGDMGAMVWVSDKRLCATLDKTDVWESRYPPVTDPNYRYQVLRQLVAEKKQDEILRIFNQQGRKSGEIYATKLPLPRLWFDFGSPTATFTARLRLFTAEADGMIGLADGRSFTWRSFLHARQNVFVWERESVDDDLKLAVDKSHFNRQVLDFFKLGAYPAAVDERKNDWLTYEQAIPGQGSYAVVVNKERDGQTDRIWLSITCESAEGAAVKVAQTNIKQALAQGVGKERTSHRRWWRMFWDRSFLTIPDVRLEGLYYAEMYKLGCNHRPDKPPCPLQGVWTRGDGGMPEWCGEYALNQNVQQAYWPVYASNRLELGQGLYDWAQRVLPVFEKRGRDFFGFDGTLVGSVGLHGEPICGWFTVDFWPGLGAWLTHMLWLHWLYSRDERFLREQAYPVMKPFMRTYLNLVEKEADGNYHLPLSASPEYSGNNLEAWDKDVTADLYLMRWLAGALLETTEILKIDDPEAPRWRDLLDNLAESPQGRPGDIYEKGGLWLSAHQSLDKEHGLHAQLIGVYPLGNLNIEGSAKDRQLVDDSLNHVIWRGMGGWTGCHVAWMASIAARCRRGNMAWQMLKNYLRYYISLNTLHINGDPRHFGVTIQDYEPMTLDAGFAASTAVMEMLLQSWKGIIRVFPAMPDFWYDAYYRDLRAEGAFLVTAKWVDRRVVFIEIASEAVGACHVANPFDGDVIVKNLKTGESRTMKDSIIAFETCPGDRLRLYPGGMELTSDDLAPVVFRRRREETNCFGVKRRKHNAW